ncbi:TAXI family TRAP transporter solute-binding subunit [Bacillota bacterium Meth-B3]|nr:TAXI family TRAP transporter solute-binding subunit [Christensenellaceae bacterium]
MKRVLSIALCALLLMAVPASATEFLYMATGGTSGTYYALGGEIANLFAKNIEGLDVTAQSTGASAENIRLIDRGEAELGIVQNDVADYAFNGVNAFEGEQIQNFDVVASMYPEVVQLVVNADAGINTLADLKGKKVSIGAAGSGVYFNAVQYLEVAGLTVNDIDAQLLSFAESADAIKNRQIDAAFITAGFPNPAIQELGATASIKLLNLDDETIGKLIEKYPFYAKVTIPAGTYPNQAEDANMVGIRAIMICKKDLSEDLVYNMVKTLYEKTSDISHAKGAEITIDKALLGVSTPVHPGAAKYYAEKGIQ